MKFVFAWMCILVDAAIVLITHNCIISFNFLVYCLLFCQITAYTKDGFNKISLTGCDARIFCLGVRIVKRRTVQQVALNNANWLLPFLAQILVFFLLP